MDIQRYIVFDQEYYRVIYSVKKDLLIILVVEIGHRKEIYR
ncbi:MAG: type II toxin-antitoxin system RelE family toxin [Candidatus Rhabdochlamydia sp.]